MKTALELLGSDETWGELASGEAQTMKLAPIALLLLAACAPEVDMSKVIPTPPGARDAEQLIIERYGCGLAQLYFYGPDAMDCGHGYRFTSPVSGKCVYATSWDEIIIVGLPTWAHKMSETELVHEYRHFAKDPDRDGGHTRAEWWGDYNGGHPGGEVEEMRAVLRHAECLAVLDPVAGQPGDCP